MLEFLEKEQIDKGIIQGIREYREKYPAAPELAGRVPRPRYHYYGKDVWEAAAAALLCGENLLLAGSKATGKNVLAENLAMAFGRPAWDVSFHVNMDAASLIGMDTFVGGQVTFGRDQCICAPKRGLRHSGRDQHGEKRGAGGAARHAGLPAGHRRAGI